MLTLFALAGLPAVATAADGRLSPSFQMPLPTREGARVALAVDAGGRPWLAAGATLWRLRLGERRWEPHAAPVPAPAELLGLPDGRLAVASADPLSGLVLWDPGSGAAAAVAGAPAPLRALRLAPDGTFWALHGAPVTLVHVDALSAAATRHSVPADMSDATALTVARDGRVILGTRRPSAVHVLDLPAAAIVCRLVPGGGEPSSLAADGDGRIHLVVRRPGGLSRWDVRAGMPAVVPPRPSGARLVLAERSGATWAADGRWLTRVDRPAPRVRLPERATAIAASPRGGLWVAGRTRVTRLGTRPAATRLRSPDEHSSRARGASLSMRSKTASNTRPSTSPPDATNRKPTPHARKPRRTTSSWRQSRQTKNNDLSVNFEASKQR